MSLHAHIERMRDVLNDMRPISPCLTEQMERELDAMATLVGGGEAVAGYADMRELVELGNATIWRDPRDSSFTPLFTHHDGAVQVDRKLAAAIIEGIGDIPYSTLTIEDVMREVNKALNPGGSRE